MRLDRGAAVAQALAIPIKQSPDSTSAVGAPASPAPERAQALERDGEEGFS